MITVETLERITGRKANANIKSIVAGLDALPGAIPKPHQLAHYLAQVLHESGGGRYDQEVWGPTPAQKRYDTRTDLGNTPQADGDGYDYRGRAGIQITGKSNYRQFTLWCRENVSAKAPDFVANPDAVNTDPWEGLVPIWYWSTRNLNALADKNDFKGITRKINGGFNGLADRERWYGIVALVLLGYSANGAKAFQTEHGLKPDGVIGPLTRTAMHQALVARAASKAKGVSPAPDTAKPVSPLWRAILAVLAALFGRKS